MPRTIVVEYKDEEYDVTLTVRRASALDGIERSVLISQLYGPRGKKGREAAAARSTKDQLRRILLLQGYPSCLAVTHIESRGEKELSAELPSEDFLLLPDELVYHWELAVFELNPHWVVRAPEEEDEGEAAEPDDVSASTKG